MANKWLKLKQGDQEVAKAQGSCDGTFMVKAERNTGRNSKKGSVSVTNISTGESKIIAVTQDARKPFVSADHDKYTGTLKKADVEKEGVELTFEVYSNSSRLSIKKLVGPQGAYNVWDEDGNGSNNNGSYPEYNLPTTFSVNHAQVCPFGTDLGTNFEYGLTEQYVASFKITIPRNTSDKKLFRKVLIGTFDAFSENLEITIEQGVGDAEVFVSPTTMAFGAEGGEKQATVTGNTIWEGVAVEIE